MKQTITSTDIYGNHYEVPVDQLVWRPAAYGIVINNGKILLTKQHDAFHLPGGGTDLGEMPVDGVIREVKEETGITISNPKLVDCISGFFSWGNEDGTDMTHVQSILLYFICTFEDGELSTNGFMEDEKEFGDMPEWVPLEQLDFIVAGSTVDWLAVVKKVVG